MNQQVLYKETRFKRNPSDSLDVIYNIPEKLSPVYTKIGPIKRKPIYFVNRNPSPNEHHLKSIFDENILSHRGPVLVARDYSTKRDDSPGPGPYYKKLSWEKNIQFKYYQDIQCFTLIILKEERWYPLKDIKSI